MFLFYFLKLDAVCQYPHTAAFRAFLSSFSFILWVALYLHFLFPARFFDAFRHEIKPTKAYCNPSDFP